jgi:hypothetical protein
MRLALTITSIVLFQICAFMSLLALGTTDFILTATLMVLFAGTTVVLNIGN